MRYKLISTPSNTFSPANSLSGVKKMFVPATVGGLGLAGLLPGICESVYPLAAGMTLTLLPFSVQLLKMRDHEMKDLSSVSAGLWAISGAGFGAIGWQQGVLPLALMGTSIAVMNGVQLGAIIKENGSDELKRFLSQPFRLIKWSINRWWKIPTIGALTLSGMGMAGLVAVGASYLFPLGTAIFTATALMSGALVPQIVKAVRGRSSESVATSYPALLALGMVNWFSLGMQNGDFRTMISSGLTMLSASVLLGVKIYHNGSSTVELD